MLSRNRPWTWTKEEDERLRALVAQGASAVKAAAALKRKIVSVRTRARVLGYPFPPLRAVRQKWADTSDNV
jgi:GcrA cell cycle regulator